jgi:2-polyprenyl-3-methyl-5-hydroxy-6-metoxy-1,4-benzoquinol methylase
MGITSLFWDKLANRFDRQERGYKQAHIKTVENTKKYLKSSDHIIDYGCATGSTAFELADQVEHIQGIDYSSKMIEVAKRRTAELKIQNVDFTQTTIFDKGFEKGSFDVILAFGILHLLHNPRKAIQRINELLKPNGVFISSTACIGENKMIPILMNTIAFIPSLIGLLPSLRFPEIQKLEQTITLEKFQIIEAETLTFGPTHNETYIVARFIAAKKIPVNSGRS